MSGGVAYVLDEEGDFAIRCNAQMVGGRFILIQGTALGPVGTPTSLSFGPTSFPSRYTSSGCTVTTAYTSVSCPVVPGVGGNFTFTLTSGTSLNEKLLALPGIALVMVLFSTMLIVEVERSAPNATIKTGGDALWWALTTVTTVTSTDPEGKARTYSISGGADAALAGRTRSSRVAAGS